MRRGGRIIRSPFLIVDSRLPREIASEAKALRRLVMRPFPIASADSDHRLVCVKRRPIHFSAARSIDEQPHTAMTADVKARTLVRVLQPRSTTDEVQRLRHPAGAFDSRLAGR